MLINYKTLILLCVFLTILPDLIAQDKLTVVPHPQKVTMNEGDFSLNSETKISCDIKNYDIARSLQSFLRSGINSSFEISPKAQSNCIRFEHDVNLDKEAYILNITPHIVTISASSKEGWFYGVQTLKQLLPAGFGIDGERSEKEKIRAVLIEDKARFGWRAFMLDESRYFKGMEQVKLLLDEMAYLKMNVFHWHLVDDAGWRIEIKKYPLLTEIGSKRKSSQIGPKKWNSNRQSGVPHSGYYTQEEIKEIVQYAAERMIDVVPEIEMPGHSSAAIAAYPWLGTEKKEIEVPIRFGNGPDVYDVSNDKTISFLKDVIDEITPLFPSSVIHIGGDEVDYVHWKSSDVVKKYMDEKELNTPAELQIYFTNGMSRYIQSKGKRMMGWNEILGHNVHDYHEESDTKTDKELAKETIIHFWKGDIDLATEAVEQGYDIVNSLHTDTYLDYDYYSIPLAKAYDFDPIPFGLDPKYYDKVIGIGCQMWGEWIPTPGEMHYQVFPRIAAYAEVGWTDLDNKDYPTFLIALKDLQERWKSKDIYYAPDQDVEKENK